MKLRTAEKILSRVGTPDEQRYSQFQIQKARARMDRTQSSRDAERYWSYLMDRLGVDGRAKVLNGLGHAGDAFRVLMEGA